MFTPRIDLTGEPENPSPPQSTLARVFGLIAALLLLWGVFMLGAVAAQRSSRPPLVGPIRGIGNAETVAVVVHIAGRVKNPGVYELAPNARVREAILKAGGPLPDANLHALNLAAWVEDGEKITVPARAKNSKNQSDARVLSPPVELPRQEPVTENAPPLPERQEPQSGYPSSPLDLAPQMMATPAKRRSNVGKSTLPPENDGVPRAQTEKGEVSSNADPNYLRAHPLNINTATSEQLQLLPGIGPAMAQRILDYRETNGKFRDVEELQKIRGIGEKRMEALRALITTGMAQSTPAATISPAPTPR